MNFLLMWASQNKLATVLAGVIIVLGIGYGIQTSRVNLALSKIEVLENKLEASEIALSNLQAKSEDQVDKIEVSKKRIKSIIRQYEKYIKDLKESEVPVVCEEAVNWGATEMNKIIGGEK